MDDNLKRAFVLAPFSPLAAGYHVAKGIVDKIIPESSGGMYVGNRATAAGLNAPRWARIIDKREGSSDTIGHDTLVRYAWEECTWQRLPPGSKASRGLIKVDGGLDASPHMGTVDRNPAIDPNGAERKVGDFVLIRMEFYDPVYDWVFSIISGAGTSQIVDISLDVSPVEVIGPDGNGYYNGLLLSRYNPITFRFEEQTEIKIVDLGDTS